MLVQQRLTLTTLRMLVQQRLTLTTRVMLALPILTLTTLRMLGQQRLTQMIHGTLNQARLVLAQTIFKLTQVTLFDCQKASGGLSDPQPLAEVLFLAGR